MFNVDEAVADWRRQMAAGGVSDPALLHEFESHLREDLRALVSAGTPEAQAFELAVSRLGKAGPLRKEFNKLPNARCWPVAIGSWLFVGALVLTAAWMSKRLLDGKWGLLLFAHVLSITAGYGAAFFAGSCGIFYVCCRFSHALWPNRRQALGRAVLMFSQVSAGTVILGTALAMLWSHRHLARYWMGDAKEIGGLCVSLWFVVSSLMQRRGLVSERVAMLMCIGGNVVVSLAWFGAGILEASQKANGTVGYWPLALSLFLGLHLVFLVMGVAPAPEAEKS